MRRGSAPGRGLLHVRPGRRSGLPSRARRRPDISLLLAISIFHVPANLGYGILFALILIESAGAPVPGETSLIAAGILASEGHLSLPIVFAVAISAAVSATTSATSSAVVSATRS